MNAKGFGGSLPRKLFESQLGKHVSLQEICFLTREGKSCDISDIITDDLKFCIIQGFTRDGSHLISYSLQECAASDYFNGISLQLWTFCRGERCRRVWSIPLFPVGDLLTNNEMTEEIEELELTDIWERIRVTVWETTDSSQLIIECFDDLFVRVSEHPEFMSPRIEKHHIAIIPGPAAPVDQRASIATLKIIVSKSRKLRGSIEDVLTVAELPHGGDSTWAGNTTAVLMVWDGNELNFIHTRLERSSKLSSGWITEHAPPLAFVKENSASRAQWSEAEKVKKKLGWRACWEPTMTEPGRSKQGSVSNMWLSSTDAEELFGLRFTQVERRSGAGTPAAATLHDASLPVPAPLEISVRIPAHHCNAEIPVQCTLHERMSTKHEVYVLVDYAAQLFRDKTAHSQLAERSGIERNPHRWCYTHSGQPGVLLFVQVHFEVYSRRFGHSDDDRPGSTGQCIVQIAVHVPAETGLAEILCDIPVYDHPLYDSSVDFPKAFLDFMWKVEAAEAVPVPPYFTPRKLVNINVLEYGTSLRILNHPWLPQEVVHSCE